MGWSSIPGETTIIPGVPDRHIVRNFAGGAVSVGLAGKMKLKVMLPAANIALRLLLLRWDNSLSHLAGACDSPGPSPADRLLMSMNAPLIFQLRIWYYSFSYPWNVAMEMIAVGLLWYWVAVNISSWRSGGNMITLSWRPARFGLDATLIILGLIFGLLAVNETRWGVIYAEYMRRWGLNSVGCFGPISYQSLAAMAAACFYLGWCAVLVLFCGRDVIQGRRGAVGLS